MIYFLIYLSANNLLGAQLKIKQDVTMYDAKY